MRMPRSTAELKHSLSNPTYGQVAGTAAFVSACVMNAMSDGNNTAALLLMGFAAFGLYAIATKPVAQGFANRVLLAPKTEVKTEVKTEDTIQPQPK